MFEGKKLNKVEKFGKDLEEKIRNDKTIKNSEVYLFTLVKGHPIKHANKVVKALKSKKLVQYEGVSPKINYESLKKKENLIEIKWIGQ